MVHPQELLFICCTCRLWYVVRTALSDTSRWYNVSLMNSGQTQHIMHLNAATDHTQWPYSYLHSSNIDTTSCYQTQKSCQLDQGPHNWAVAGSTLPGCDTASHLITTLRKILCHESSPQYFERLYACTVTQHHIQEYLDFHITLFHTGFRISILDHSTQQFAVNVGQENVHFGIPMPFVNSPTICTHLSKRLDNLAQPLATATTWRVNKFNFLQNCL